MSPAGTTLPLPSSTTVTAGGEIAIGVDTMTGGEGGVITMTITTGIEMMRGIIDTDA